LAAERPGSTKTLVGRWFRNNAAISIPHTERSAGIANGVINWQLLWIERDYIAKPVSAGHFG
jgi:hypothetical protein